MANRPASRSSPSNSGTNVGCHGRTVRSHSASAALRSTGASHTAETFNCANARLTQKRRASASTSWMSDDTPPVSGVSVTSSPGRSRCRRIKASMMELSAILHHPLALFAQAIDPQAHGLAGSQVDRIWLLTRADAGRRTGGDHVARLQAHEAAEIGDDERYGKDHGPGRTVLHAFAVHLQPHVEILCVGDLI